MCVKNGKYIKCQICGKEKYYSGYRFKNDKNPQFCSISCSKKGKSPWNKGKRGIQKAWNKGIPMTKEAKTKMIESKKGTIPWNKGKKTGLIPKTSFQKGMMPWNKGLTKEKDERIRRMIEHLASCNIGREAWNKNKPGCYSQEAIEKFRQAYYRRIKKIEDHPRWLGGKSFEPYPIEFNKKLKQRIKKYNNNICQKCNISSNESILHVHHKNYNKNDNRIENLITLCNSCHTKTNTNREYWKNYFLNNFQLEGK